MVNLDHLKKEAKRALKDGKVKYIIGYTRSTTKPFVSVQERMVEDYRIAERCSFRDSIRIQIAPVKCCPWLSNR